MREHRGWRLGQKVRLVPWWLFFLVVVVKAVLRVLVVLRHSALVNYVLAFAPCRPAGCHVSQHILNR